MSHFTSARPIENIEKAIDHRIYIKLKGRRSISAILRSFDEHLNLFLEETVETYNYFDKEKNEYVTVDVDLDSIILRGDNVVFLTLDELVFENEKKENETTNEEESTSSSEQ